MTIAARDDPSGVIFTQSHGVMSEYNPVMAARRVMDSATLSNFPLMVIAGSDQSIVGCAAISAFMMEERKKEAQR